MFIHADSRQLIAWAQADYERLFYEGYYYGTRFTKKYSFIILINRKSFAKSALERKDGSMQASLNMP